MKIALLSPDATPLAGASGVPAHRRGRLVAALARELGAAGHTVDVFTRRTDLWSAPVVELAPGANVIHVPAGPPRFLAAANLLGHMDDFAARVAAACGGARYDVVHASFYPSGPAALRARARHGTPVVATLHEVVRPAPAPAGVCLAKRAQIERRLATDADRCVAFDSAERDRLVDAFGIDAERIQLIPAGVDAALFAPGSRAARGRFGFRGRDFVVLQRARLQAGSGVDTALGALVLLRRGCATGVRLMVVAELDERDPFAAAELARLRAAAALAGVADQVTFVAGGVSQHGLRETYAAADAVLIVPDEAAAAPTPLEAMACGLPVVGADLGALRDAIRNEVTGFLVPPGDASAVADRLARLSANAELARAYGRASLLRVRSAYTWRHVAARLARTYAAVLEPHRARLAAAASR